MSRRTERGKAEYDALTRALANVTPPCTNDPRFILEAHEIQRDELTHISITVCRACPLRDLCRSYAEAARPESGIWAGRTYGPKYKRKEPNNG